MLLGRGLGLDQRRRAFYLRQPMLEQHHLLAGSTLLHQPIRYLPFLHTVFGQRSAAAQAILTARQNTRHIHALAQRVYPRVAGRVLARRKKHNDYAVVRLACGYKPDEPPHCLTNAGHMVDRQTVRDFQIIALYKAYHPGRGEPFVTGT